MAKQIILAACCLAFAACGDDHIDEYTMVKAPAETVAEDHTGHDHAAHASESTDSTVASETADAAGAEHENALTDPRSVVWTAPDAWTSQGAGGMRLASYQLPDAGDLSVISLGGDGGGLLANVNRWRNQVGLDPIEQAQLATQTQIVKSSIGDFVAMKLINPETADKAICGAVFAGSGVTLFVKLTGSQACIEKHAEAVFAFCAQAKVP